MSGLANLAVRANLAGDDYEVGNLFLRDKRVFFKYDPSFTSLGLDLSPLKLPLSDAVRSSDTPIFDGLFGLFADSLPDGWGRLLIDRSLNDRGIPLGEINVIDRLAMVGNKGPGALTYHPMQPAGVRELDSLKLDEVAAEAQSVWSGKESLKIDGLVQLGGSSGGARPKILVGYEEERDKLIPFTPELPAAYSHWIIKFPAPNDPPEIGRIEMAYYEMACAAGVEMSECKLFKGQSGRLYFGTKRFDRLGNRRLHLHSAAGLLHDNFRLSDMDYGHLMDAAFRLERHASVYRKVLRLAAFNVFAHNRDDHSKNFSFLMDGNGKWRFAPAYDLTYSITAHGHHSTTVAGEGKSPGVAHLRELAKIFAVPEVDEIIEEVRTALSDWDDTARKYDISKPMRQDIQHLINRLS